MSVRFGLLGTGFWASETQATALAAHSGTDFVGVWGRDPAKATVLAERFGIRPYDDPDALIGDVDAVAIALPPDVQAGLALRAARAGRHLLLDKPLALDRDDAAAIVAEVAAANLASVVFFTNRFSANVDAFLRETAETGGWDGVRATMFAAIFQPGNPFGASPWRRERGGLWDIGPHALSIILPVLGPVREVTAVDGPRGTVHMVARHDAGQVSTLALSLDAAPAAVSHEFVFYGEHGLATVPSGDRTAVDAFGTALDQLLHAIATGSTRHPCDVRFGREVVDILAAADTARRERRTVELPRTE
ncbi:Gfo/Idh/MocA family protein [Allonocardiopsis opalescens]|uniref:Putative dehydrogenase n=1 Tax=Allonocardiopsis opalescens TaxID=1144618 RepID=A0A2T0PZ68_9ACTN|nr:Gfo/Idh/MocA family oxidoreductase [Allonocardiopsis opalescens]PRX96810.1 putative dehydrogenase [Allonocardiopsis opalescens]